LNLNKLAKAITLKEGKKHSLSIAQVKEVIKLLFKELGKYATDDVVKTINRHKRR